jgi:hypothetical protein
VEHAIDGFRPILTTKANEAVRLAVCASSGILPIGHAEEWLTRGGPWFINRKPSNSDELTAKIKIGCVRHLAPSSSQSPRSRSNAWFILSGSHLPERDCLGRRALARASGNRPRRRVPLGRCFSAIPTRPDGMTAVHVLACGDSRPAQPSTYDYAPAGHRCEEFLSVVATELQASGWRATSWQPRSRRRRSPCVLGECAGGASHDAQSRSCGVALRDWRPAPSCTAAWTMVADGSPRRKVARRAGAALLPEVFR